ncbi:hypothetical protein SAPIO_CDS4290 [Scedosporium apiospermum]|uniref:Uncharacterized protein n=1 Tax=Pseudallescheria apiosperma TaxID=563466 RepID=A0A084G8L4_PSEDA|nr:uncharacterized protein SAPIO_CDS4290 [Scedosporium apiospermum]KEZ43676.1 hypothetical protein SAPIO_CDS4290 [Scedosporium apiospermum]
MKDTKERQVGQPISEELLETIEEMSRAFTEFVDEVLETQTIGPGNPALLNNLHHVSARILSLAKGAVDVEGMGTPSPTLTHPNNQLGIGQGAEAKLVVSGGPGSLGPISDYNGMDPTVGSSLRTPGQALPSNIRVSIPTEQGTIESTFQSMSRTTSMPIIPSRQVFGNGWTTSTMPELSGIEPIQRLSPDITTALSALGSFSLRLLEATLIYGYRLLLEHVQEKTDEAGLALCSRPPQQLAAVFRWLLGPGKEYMYRMSGVAWEASHGAALQPPDSSPPFSMPPCSDATLEVNHSREKTEYLTAIGVQRRLQSLGAKMLDADTMELQVDGSRFGTEDDLRFFSSGPMPPASWSYIDFFSVYHAQPSSVTMILRVPEFIQNMTQISTCLGNGPGYSKKELARVMKASASIVK